MKRRRLALVLALGLVVALCGVTAVWTNAFGASDRVHGLLARVELFLDPPPNRPTRPTVTVTPRPVAIATPSPTPRPTAPQSLDPSASPAVPTPEPTPAPTPVRRKVDRDILRDHERYFAHELENTWCATAGVQMVLAIHGRGDTSDKFQRELQRRVDEWESWEDSHNGKWGPGAMALALDAYGVPGYEIRAYESRQDALRDAAVAIDTTGAPVLLLAWRGAHTWVMTGYRANADPAIFPDAKITGAYILDPWYPWVSSIWGKSDPPGTFQDESEMKRNYLAWKRPEGRYPDRDGKFIAVVPTLPNANR